MLREEPCRFGGVRVNAVVAMFDSGGSSGQLRDQFGVPPSPGDVLRCALALARNESEARRVLLSRLPALENGRLGGHTGGNLTSLMPTLLVKGVADELQAVEGPVVLVANLLTEGRAMRGFSAGKAVRRVGEAIGRPVDVAVVNSGHLPPGDALGRYAAEHKEPLPAGDFPAGCEVLTGRFRHGPIARHERQRLAYAVWRVLAWSLLA